jgi:hypothetical protein
MLSRKCRMRNVSSLRYTYGKLIMIL